MGISTSDVLRDVRGYATAGRVHLTRHARERLYERCGGLVEHVKHALRNARDCADDGDERRWKVTGPDLDGDMLTMIVVIDDGVVVVTLF